MAAQMNYSFDTPKGVAGGKVDLAYDEVVTRQNEEADGKLIANREIKRLGRKAYSVRADDLAFGTYNRAFAPARTKFDWVSASEANVDAYIADPLCGGNTTLGLFRDMLDGLTFITRQSNMDRMDKALPVYFISGDQDPVGDMGRPGLLPEGGAHGRADEALPRPAPRDPQRGHPSVRLSGRAGLAGGPALREQCADA